MSVQIQNKQFFKTTIVSIVFAVALYSTLSYAHIPPRITVSLSIVTSLIVFGLIWYYSSNRSYGNEKGKTIPKEEINHIDISTRNNIENWLQSLLLFFIFSVLLIIASFSYDQKQQVFTNWNEIGIWPIIQLTAAIMLCFFIPGYALIHILSKKFAINQILSVLLSYLLSILITGIAGYVSALGLDSSLAEDRHIFIAVYLAVLAFYLVYQLWGTKVTLNLQIRSYFDNLFSPRTIFKYLELRGPELLVFGGLLGLVIISTYVLYGGVTIGDQWYHQGRALLFMSGSIREAVLTNGEASIYPPFQSALLASLTVLSGTPLVNTYASIAFLNATLIFAFYYFFTAWVPIKIRKAALLAAVLFTMSSGFGWIYYLNITTNDLITSPQSSLRIMTSIRSLDIVDPNNYAIPTAPDFSTALIYIALPAGFVLLALVRTSFDTKFNILIITAITVLGILSHYEFYIFVIIASILPIIFKMKNKNSLYCSLLIGTLIVLTISVTTPGNFFTTQKISGIPLLFLNVSFVTITWIIYLTSSYLQKFFSIKTKSIAKHIADQRKLLDHRRVKFSIVSAIIIISTYLYLLSFVILGQQPINTINEQTAFGTVPWFVYPMKIGTAGILSLIFIFSYIFKKFEKQLFVFGIIIIIAFLAGPYYSESRFSKYIMIGMVGLASVMIYKILNWRHTKNSMRNATIIPVIIFTSGLSVLFFIGYNALILETQSYIDTLPRRHFPSASELSLLETLHGLVNITSDKYNVISFSDLYNRWKDGFMAKIPSFAGLPYEKVRQSPLALNASTPDALYHLLDYSDAKFIIMPKDRIQNSSSLTEPTRFVSKYFKTVYEDKKYILLEVPILVAPEASFNSRVGLVYNQSDNLATKTVTDSRLLQFDNSSFDIDKHQKWITTQKENQTLLSILGAETDKGITVWSKNIMTDNRVNYIEARLRIVSENENKSDIDSVRVEWQEGGNQWYYAKLSDDGLELYKKSKGVQFKDVLLKSTEIEKNNWMWYNLRIENRDDSTNLYLNNVLWIQAPRSDNMTEPISKISLYTKYNNVEFKPLRIGTISDYPQNNSEGIEYYDYYYPLSLLSLSKSSYDVFKESDSSVFSKQVIVLPSSLITNNATFMKYLDHVHKGGTLIVAHSQNNFSTIFDQLFSLPSNVGEEQSFTHIEGQKNQKIVNISGMVNTINYTHSSDIDVVASYRNSKNQTIAPFILEKSFPAGGKIILLNSKGYFNSISNSPIKYFFTLSNISQLIPADMGKGVISQNTSTPSKGFIGKMETSGRVILNSSSLSFHNEENNPHLIKSSRIVIFNGTDNPIVVKNISIKELKIVGEYVASAHVSGPLKIPSASVGDYIAVDVPTSFNITISATPNGSSHIEIAAQNQNSTKSFIINNYSKVEFYNVKDDSPAEYVPLVLKRPDVQVDGHIIFKNADFKGFLNERGGVNSGISLDLDGQLKTKFEHVDKFDLPYGNTTKTAFVTYLKTLSINGSLNEDKDKLNLPGDIYFKAKMTGQDIDLKKIMTSSANIILLIILIPIFIILIKFIWNRTSMQYD